MDRGLIARLAALLVTASLSGLACGEKAGPPSESVAFLSYLQFASSLATELAKYQKAAEYQRERESLVMACDELEALQKKFQALSLDDRRSLAQEHAQVVGYARDRCQKLFRNRAQSVQVLGQDWERYERAFRDALGP